MTQQYKVTNKLAQVVHLNLWLDEDQTRQTTYALPPKATAILPEWRVSQDLGDKYVAKIVSVEKLPVE